VASICTATGVRIPRVGVPAPVARAAGAVVERLCALARHGDPPMTRFLAEQLSTAHWFDQRATRAALGWAPRVGLEEGFARLRAASSAQAW
jgi:2-alkyl-3-oxoalkanoate reductase